MYRDWQVDVWKPDIVLLNSRQDFKLLGDDSLLVEVNADGTIVWYPYQASVTQFKQESQIRYLKHNFVPRQKKNYEGLSLG